MASITPYKDGWRAQIKIGDVRDSGTFRTKREANAWSAAREHEIRQQIGKSPGERYTLRQMLERYDRDVIPSKGSARSESLRLRAFLRNFPELSAMTLDQIKTPQLVTWRDARLNGFARSDGEKVPAVSNSSVQRDLSWLRNAFNVARKEWHWMEGDPFEGFRRPAEDPPRDRRVLPIEVKRICRRLGYRSGHAPQTRSQEVALAFLVALRTAMRAGEILSLGKSTLDIKRRVARVPHKTQHLTGKPREVPLTRHGVRLLRAVAEREKCFSITSASLDAMFRKTRGQLAVLYPSIADLHFHDSRAEALTRLAKRVDLLTLARISGHADLAMIGRVYYRESAEDIAARI